VELAIALLGMWLFMVLAPDAPISRFLRHALVVLPARGLSRIPRGSLVAVGLVAIVATTLWMIDEELLGVFAMGAPEALAYLSMIEIGTLVDAVIAVTFIATTTRFPRLTAILRNMRPRARATRARRPQRPTPSNDDDGRPGYVVAA